MNIVVTEVVHYDLLASWEVYWQIKLGQQRQHVYGYHVIAVHHPDADGAIDRIRLDCIAAMKRIELLRRCRVPLEFEFRRAA